MFLSFYLCLHKSSSVDKEYYTGTEI